MDTVTKRGPKLAVIGVGILSFSAFIYLFPQMQKAWLGMTESDVTLSGTVTCNSSESDSFTFDLDDTRTRLVFKREGLIERGAPFITVEVDGRSVHRFDANESWICIDENGVSSALFINDNS